MVIHSVAVESAIVKEIPFKEQMRTSLKQRSGCKQSDRAGDDHLRGSNDHDTISGGDGDDVLVGRDGHDLLEGGDGENLYLPGDGNDSITGGNNLDIIFIEGEIDDFTALHSNGGECTQTSCIVSKIPSGDIKTITGGEVIIFDDARLDLYSE